MVMAGLAEVEQCPPRVQRPKRPNVDQAGTENERNEPPKLTYMEYMHTFVRPCNLLCSWSPHFNQEKEWITRREPEE